MMSLEETLFCNTDFQQIEADFAYLKSHCSTTGTYRKLEDDTDMLAAMEIAKVNLIINFVLMILR